LDREAQIDYVALRNRIAYNLDRLGLDEQRAAQMKPLLPFFDDIRLLQEDRFDRKRVDPRTAAATLDRIATQANELAKGLKEPAPKRSAAAKRRQVAPGVAARAAAQVQDLREVLKDFHGYYDGYDPEYSWWARKPYTDADGALQAWGDAIRSELLGIEPGGK